MNSIAEEDVREALYEFVKLVDLGAAALRGIIQDAEVSLRRELFSTLDAVASSTSELQALYERFAVVPPDPIH